jgi:hypothetical protein
MARYAAKPLSDEKIDKAIALTLQLEKVQDVAVFPELLSAHGDR